MYRGKYKGLSRAHFILSQCNRDDSNADKENQLHNTLVNSEVEKRNQPPLEFQNVDERKSKTPPFTSVSGDVSVDPLNEALKHSILFGEDLNITSHNNALLDTSNTNKNFSIPQNDDIDSETDNIRFCPHDIQAIEYNIQNSFNIEQDNTQQRACNRSELPENNIFFQSAEATQNNNCVGILNLADAEVGNMTSKPGIALYSNPCNETVNEFENKEFSSEKGDKIENEFIQAGEQLPSGKDAGSSTEFIEDEVVFSEREEDVVDEETDSSDEEDSSESRKRRKARQFQQGLKRQKNIDLRNSGKEYKGLVRVEDKKYVEQTRPARAMGDRCRHTATKSRPSKVKSKVKNDSSRTFLCANVNDDLRETRFNEFWSLKSWDAKRVYLLGLVDKRKPYKRRPNSEESKKDNALDCYFHDKNGMKIRVCRTFFLNTLALGRDSFNRWMSAGITINNSEEENPSANTYKVPKRIKEMRQSVMDWLELIPKVPSHYCRSSSSRIYVESTFQSISHMHSIYEQWCKDNNKRDIASRVTFSKIIENQKVSIHKPRKDQCDICYQYNVGNLNEEEYKEHRKKKEEAREIKAKEKSEVSDKKLVVTMDLQSVLLCPKLLVSKIYYAQKLQVHDFTIYSLNNGDVFLYVWHEGEGHVTSNEFVSCLSDFVEKMSDHYEEIVLISDGCNYQNRNRVLSSQLLNLAVTKQILIKQVILEKGHTMMEADSVHSTLENLFKPPICSPGDYVSRMRTARPKKPYNVYQIDHTFFKDYESQPNNFTSIRPGRKAGDPTVMDIRALQYLPSGVIQYKIRHTEEWTDLPQRRPNKPPLSLKPLYIGPPKIKRDKFNHLQELKLALPAEYHPFYDSLVHE